MNGPSGGQALGSFTPPSGLPCERTQDFADLLAETERAARNLLRRKRPAAVHAHIGGVWVFPRILPEGYLMMAGVFPPTPSSRKTTCIPSCRRWHGAEHCHKQGIKIHPLHFE